MLQIAWGGVVRSLWIVPCQQQIFQVWNECHNSNTQAECPSSRDKLQFSPLQPFTTPLFVTRTSTLGETQLTTKLAYRVGSISQWLPAACGNSNERQICLDANLYRNPQKGAGKEGAHRWIRKSKSKQIRNKRGNDQFLGALILRGWIRCRVSDHGGLDSWLRIISMRSSKRSHSINKTWISMI